MAFNFSPKIVTDGLVLHLDAANRKSYVSGSTAWNDLSRGRNNGTLVNGPTFNAANGGGIVFDGSNDFVQCTGTVLLTAATFIAWIQRNGTQGAYAGILFSRGTSVTGINFEASSNQLGYHWNGAANTYTWNSGLTLPDLAWSMCAISVTSTTATAYLYQTSGLTTATNTVFHTSTTLDDIKIAQDDIGGRFFNGNIAQTSIYNRALSATEILQNYNATKGRFGL